VVAEEGGFDVTRDEAVGSRVRDVKKGGESHLTHRYMTSRDRYQRVANSFVRELFLLRDSTDGRIDLLSREVRRR